MSYPDDLAPDQRLVFWHLVTSAGEDGKSFPHPHQHRLRAVAVLIISASEAMGELKVKETLSETDLVRWLVQEMDIAGDPVHVGLMNFRFGNPVLISTALRHGLVLPQQFTKLTHPRCEDVAAWLTDFTLVSGGFGLATSLLNLPSRPQLDVGKLLLDPSKIKKVLARLKLDVGVIALAWMRMAVVRGLISPAQHTVITKQIWSRLQAQKSALIHQYCKRAKAQKEN